MRRQAALLACLVLPLFLVPGWSTQADGKAPVFGQAQILLDNQPAPPASLAVTGFALAARTTGPQVALMQRPGALLFGLGGAEEAAITIPVRGLEGAFTVTAQATVLGEGKAEATLTVDGSTTRKTLDAATGARIEIAGVATLRGNLIRLGVRSQAGTPAVRWRDIRLAQGGRSWDIAVKPAQADPNRVPPPILPPLRPALEQALIEWDWRMQDGIGTERQPSSYAEATARTLQRGDALLRDLAAGDVSLVEEQRQWHQLRQRHEEQARAKGVSEHAQEQLWLQVHSLRRRIALRNPLAQTGSIVFAKQVPGSFSHQLTQYLGRFARPGGGLFVLEEPGQSMKCRQLVADALPEGSYQHPDVSHDGKRVLFSYCQVAATARSWNAHSHLHYHLYEVGADGSGLKQLTEGDFNDFSPRYLPNGQLVFISTRRGGWHRCGGRPGEGCENHTLALANADGSSPRPISFHETQEWDPSVLDDGRILYTRWDYVDRHAVFYQQLFTCRADGSATATFYGNNTFNPVGTWEARQVPGSRRVMATAGAHHAMTAGSIILVDPSRGVDGPAPLTRLTP
ncbi:MAG: PD40 domain-containing protein, partial [Gemmataceae bacterium]|nr:PD40 domain-containing protein [Gemmataceae bacterium]